MSIDNTNKGAVLLLDKVNSIFRTNLDLSDMNLTLPVNNINLTLPARNTTVSLSYKISTTSHGRKTISYDRLHVSKLPAITVTKGTATRFSHLIEQINQKYNLSLSLHDIIDRDIVDIPDGDSIVELPINPDSYIYYTGDQVLTTHRPRLEHEVDTFVSNVCKGNNKYSKLSDGRGGYYYRLLELDCPDCMYELVSTTTTTTTTTTTPSTTPTPTPTDTPSTTVTPSVTLTETPTPTESQTPTPTITDTPETTITPTPTETLTPSSTEPPTSTSTPESTITATPTITETPTSTTTPSTTETPVPTTSVTETPSTTISPTPTETQTPVPTTTVTESPTPTPTESLTPTVTPSVTSTPTPTVTVTETPSPTITESPTTTEVPTTTPEVTTTITTTPVPTTTVTEAPTTTLTPEPSTTEPPTTTPEITTTPTPTPTTWWTTAAGLVPLAVHDANNVSGAQLLDLIGSNHITATTDLSPGIGAVRSVGGNGAMMSYSSAVTIPENCTIIALISQTGNTSVFFDTSSKGLIFVQAYPSAGWYCRDTGSSFVYIGTTDLSNSYKFITLVKTGTNSVMYVNGVQLGSIFSGKIPAHIDRIGEANPTYNFTSSKYISALGFWSGSATQAEVVALESACRLALTN